MNNVAQMNSSMLSRSKSVTTITLDHPGVDDRELACLGSRRWHGGRARTSPSPISTDEARRFADTLPFERFGRWAAPISVARDGTIGRLARWLALNRGTAASRGEQWSRCRAANPHCFRTYQVVTLDRPSFFLPAGEVVFEVLENPTQIPDRPPQGVMLRHMEAMDHFNDATFYFLRPVFVLEPQFRLCTSEELRCEAYFDRFDAFRAAARFGWAYRGHAWCEAMLQRAARATTRQAVRFVEAIDRVVTPILAFDLDVDLALLRRRRSQLEFRIARADSLGLAAESRHLRAAINDLERVVERRRRWSLDPVLCFELDDRPGELWFEAHWYTGSDDRTYVHY